MTDDLIKRIEAHDLNLQDKWVDRADEQAWMDEADALLSEAADKIDGLRSDLDNAIEVAFKRGAIEWTRLNYPDHYARLATVPLTYPVEYDVLPVLDKLQDRMGASDSYLLGSAMLEIHELRRALSKKEESE